MARTAFDNGFIIVTIRYVALRKDGLYFYNRRVPTGLEGHHGGKKLIRKSLGRSMSEAARKAKALAAEHDALWAMLKAPEAARQGLTTIETRAGAKALLESLDLIPGGAESYHWHDHPVDDYFESRYGDAYLEARHGERADQAEIERLTTPIEKEAMRQVKALNTFLDGFEIQGGGFHGIVRIFNEGDTEGFDWNKGGRLYGASDRRSHNFQLLPGEERLKMTIGAEPVAEIDISGSYLTLLHGLQGLAFDTTSDPYAVEGFDRSVVKAWLTATLGRQRAEPTA